MTEYRDRSAARITQPGGAYRLKIPILPKRDTSEEAQTDLDAYAQQRKWRRVD